MAFVNKVTDFAALSQVPSATLDAMQERSLIAACFYSVGAGVPGPDPAPSDAVDPANPSREQTGPGGQQRLWLHNSTLLTGSKMMVLDASVDWRDRLIWLPFFHVATSLNDIPGGSNDDDMPSSARNAEWTGGAAWYSGTGALASGSVNPSDGNPPATGYARALLDPGTFATDNLVLYVEGASPYRLCVYNQTGGAARALLALLCATAPLGKR